MLEPQCDRCGKNVWFDQARNAWLDQAGQTQCGGYGVHSPLLYSQQIPPYTPKNSRKTTVIVSISALVVVALIAVCGFIFLSSGQSTSAASESTPNSTQKPVTSSSKPTSSSAATDQFSPVWCKDNDTKSGKCFPKSLTPEAIVQAAKSKGWTCADFDSEGHKQECSLNKDGTGPSIQYEVSTLNPNEKRVDSITARGSVVVWGQNPDLNAMHQQVMQYLVQAVDQLGQIAFPNDQKLAQESAQWFHQHIADCTPVNSNTPTAKVGSGYEVSCVRTPPISSSGSKGTITVDSVDVDIAPPLF